MTRNRELDLEDLTSCTHQPEIAVSDGRGGIDHWLCRCGKQSTPEDNERKNLREEICRLEDALKEEQIRVLKAITLAEVAAADRDAYARRVAEAVRRVVARECRGSSSEQAPHWSVAQERIRNIDLDAIITEVDGGY